MGDFDTGSFTDTDAAIKRAGTPLAIEILVHKVTKMESALEKMAEAMSRLARVEERQTSDKEAVARAFESIKSISDRLVVLEQAAPLNKQAQVWTTNAIWAAAGLMAMYIAKKVGLIS